MNFNTINNQLLLQAQNYDPLQTRKQLNFMMSLAINNKELESVNSIEHKNFIKQQIKKVHSSLFNLKTLIVFIKDVRIFFLKRLFR